MALRRPSHARPRHHPARQRRPPLHRGQTREEEPSSGIDWELIFYGMEDRVLVRTMVEGNCWFLCDAFCYEMEIRRPVVVVANY